MTRPHATRSLALLAASPLLALAASAQGTTQIPLNYNFNGIVHSGEAGAPDAPAGFRSISDRALNFTSGVPVDPLLAPYSIVGTAGSLDIVHLGNRNVVSGGAWFFDASPDADGIGIQPSWLPAVDQTGPQTTVLGAPIPIQAGFQTTASFLYQISNGGGSFDVTFGFMSGNSTTVQLSGGDWFGGGFAGTGGVDSGTPDANLSITEGTVDLSANAGETLTSIAFSNGSNSNAGYAILAANVTETLPTVVVQVPLNYNFNGVIHMGEAGAPDAMAGFRSISDRALDFAGGVPSDALLDKYSIVSMPGVLDVVHLGNRNTVDNGNWAFDLTNDGDNIGVQPSWLPMVDQSGPQTTVLGAPIPIVSGDIVEASFLYQISNGGGSFDVTFGFMSGGTYTAPLNGPDWFGGVYAGTGQVDMANPDNNLSITEGTIDLTGQGGETITSITFENRSNTIAGYAILAANVSTTPIEGMFGTPDSISLNLGGSQAWTLAAGAARAGWPYLVLGSTSGTVPGFAIDDVTLPLNVDLYTVFTLQHPNGALLSGSLGFLDGNGKGAGSFNIAPLTDPSLAGSTLHHAFLGFNTALGYPRAEYASNPVAVMLVP